MECSFKIKVFCLLAALAPAFFCLQAAGLPVAGKEAVCVMEKPDSAVAAALDAKLAEYFGNLARESAEVKKGECDFIIEAVADSSLRDYVASRAYDYYLDSHIMGDEAVAVHIFDAWFATGRTRMASDEEYLNAKIFAEFNRNSLVGCNAPSLTAFSADGSVRELFSGPGKIYSVLLFYSPDCSKCKVESILLRNFLDTESYSLNVYAFNTGDNKEKWDEYVSGYLDFRNAGLNVVHIWDPELSSDFQRKYGVLQTPALFLVSPDGRIVGRRLDAGSLALMLRSVIGERKLDYGTKESEELYDAVFSDFGGDAELESGIRSVADRIASSTLSRGDTVLFRQMTGDLLYYLAGRREGGCREGLDYVIENQILSRPDVWRTEDDSLKVVGMAEMLGGLLSRSRPGERIADLKLRGTLLSPKGEKRVSVRLPKLGGDTNIIVFHTEGCAMCEAEKRAAERLAAAGERGRGRRKILLVSVDEIRGYDPALEYEVMDAFDLSVLPFIIETDRKGTILRRYITLTED